MPKHIKLCHNNFDPDFMECWTNSNSYLTDRSATQLVNLNAGTYQFAAAVNATQQGDASVVVSGVTLRLGDNSIACHTSDGQPEIFTTEQITLDGGNTTLGLYISNTNANWVAFDNFRLLYLGSKTPGDITQDGNVGITDVIALTNIILGRSTSGYDLDAADVNGDTHINIEDITALVNLILAQ